MDEEKVKQLEDYLSSLKGGVMLEYSFEGDINKPKLLLLYRAKNGKITGQKMGPHGLDTTSLRDIAEEGLKIAIFKSIDDVLKDNQ